MLTVSKFDNLLKVEISYTRDSMYRRQSLFCAYMVRFSQTASDIRDNLKRLYGADYDAARGYLNKELKVSEEAIKDSALHQILTSGEEAKDIIEAAAAYMHKNQINHRSLFANKAKEAKTREEKIESFVASLTYAEAVAVNEAITARLEYLKKKQAEAEAEAKKQAEAKAKKQAEAEAKRIKKAEAEAEAKAKKQAKAKERITKALESYAKVHNITVDEVLNLMDKIDEAEAKAEAI